MCPEFAWLRRVFSIHPAQPQRAFRAGRLRDPNKKGTATVVPSWGVIRASSDSRHAPQARPGNAQALLFHGQSRLEAKFCGEAACRLAAVRARWPRNAFSFLFDWRCVASGRAIHIVRPLLRLQSRRGKDRLILPPVLPRLPCLLQFQPDNFAATRERNCIARVLVSGNRSDVSNSVALVSTQAGNARLGAFLPRSDADSSH